MTSGLNGLVTRPCCPQWLPHVSFGPLPPALILAMLLGWPPQALGKRCVFSGRFAFHRSSRSGLLESERLIIDHGGHGSNIISQKPFPFGICPVLTYLSLRGLLEVCFVSQR